MNLSETILKILCEPKYRYKGLWVSRAGIPTLLFSTRERDKKQLKLTSDMIGHLQRKRYIAVEGRYIKILPDGRQYLIRRSAYLQTFKPSTFKTATKNLLVLFDIPEARKAEREWFRKHLREFGYEMIQKSVWVGPSPLPKEFVQYVKKIKLDTTIKTFKLAKGYGSK